jgi:hypothetical protein
LKIFFSALLWPFYFHTKLQIIHVVMEIRWMNLLNIVLEIFLRRFTIKMISRWWASSKPKMIKKTNVVLSTFLLRKILTIANKTKSIFHLVNDVDSSQFSSRWWITGANHIHQIIKIQLFIIWLKHFSIFQPL